MAGRRRTRLRRLMPRPRLHSTGIPDTSARLYSSRPALLALGAFRPQPTVVWSPPPAVLTPPAGDTHMMPTASAEMAVSPPQPTVAAPTERSALTHFTFLSRCERRGPNLCKALSAWLRERLNAHLVKRGTPPVLAPTPCAGIRAAATSSGTSPASPHPHAGARGPSNSAGTDAHLVTTPHGSSRRLLRPRAVDERHSSTTERTGTRANLGRLAHSPSSSGSSAASTGGSAAGGRFTGSPPLSLGATSITGSFSPSRWVSSASRCARASSVLYASR